MAPSGLVISKLGIQATASQDHLTGILCLKISLPRDNTGKPGARWALFSSQAPKLISEPIILPLPLQSTPSKQKQNRNERIASRLLSLPLSSSSSSSNTNITSYPPCSPAELGRGSKPYIDVSSTTGKIFLVLDPSIGVGSGSGSGKYSHRTKTKLQTETSESPRKDWLVCLEFQVPLEEKEIIEQSVSQVILPLPRCLDNVIRLHVASHPWPSSSRHSGDIDILAEPKVLPLPSSAFKSPPTTPATPKTPLVDRKRRLSNGAKRPVRRSTSGHMMEDEAGWEDAESYPQEEVHSHSEEEYDQEAIGDVDDDDDDDDDMSEDGGSWLQGRFQSTDMLKLRWSLAASSQEDDLPSLTVNPRWDKNNPAIDMVYSAQIDAVDSTISLDVEVPEGWGWSKLAMQGDGLTHWRCLDGPWEETFIENQNSDPDATLDLPQYEDSFATVKAKRQRGLTLTQPNSTSSASLMRQTLPISPDMDFSFEAGSLENVLDPIGDSKMLIPPSLRTPRAQSITASAKKSSSPINSSITTTIAKSGRQFDLTFQSSEETEMEFVLQGTLVPLNNLTFVSPTLPIQLPLISLSSHSGSNTKQCLVTCPGARYPLISGEDKPKTNTSISSARQLCDLDAGASFVWLDQRGQPFQSLTASTVEGDIQIRLNRNIWGTITMSILLPSPRRTEELGFNIHPVLEARIMKVTNGDISMPRALYKDEKSVQIRLGKRDVNVKNDKVEVVLEISCDGTIGLPVFEKAKGNMIVELCGDNWDEFFLDKAISTNMIRSTSSSRLTYTSSLDSSSPTITFNSTTSKLMSRKQDKLNWLKWTIFNPATMLNVLLIWILISTVARVDNLQRELSFVADEARDLRLFGFDRNHAFEKRGEGDLPHHEPNKAQTAAARDDYGYSSRASTEDESSSSFAMVDMDTSSKILEQQAIQYSNVHDHNRESTSPSYCIVDEEKEKEKEKEKYPLGRVVFDQRNWIWGTLTNHPSVQTISQSMAWIWNTVIWIILHK